MPTVLLSLMGAVVAATPVTPPPWFEFKDYPMQAFEKQWEGVTKFQLLIDTQGSVAECKVTTSSGYDILDDKTCFLASKRAKFRPARDDSGTPVWGVYRSQAVWVLPERRMVNANPGSDLEVSLNKLPEGTREPPVVKLAYSVDAAGKVSSCSVMPSSQVQPTILVELGCKQVIEQVADGPVLNPTGQAVPAVKTAAVRFKAPEQEQ